MDVSKIREAATLLRSGWSCTNFIEGEAVCVMGSLAKVTDPALTEAKDMSAWQWTANNVLLNDPHFREILEMEIDAVYAQIPTKTARQTYFLDKCAGYNDPIWRTVIKVCLANYSVFKNGEAAASFLEKVADRYQQS